MSRWYNEDEFDEFAKEVEKDKEQSPEVRLGKMFHKYSSPYDVEYTLRFLPAVKDEQPSKFYRKMFLHIFANQDGEWQFITCPWTYGDKKCPLCRIVSKLYASSEREDKKIAKQMKRQVMWIANVYVVDDPTDKEDAKSTGEVKILSFKTQVEKKVREASNPKSKQGVGKGVIDPEEGFDFILKVVEKRTEDDSYPNYESSGFVRKPSAIAETGKDIKKIMDSVYSLEEYINGEKYPKDKILEIIDDEGLLHLLEDYEREQLVAEMDENPLDDEKDDEKDEEKDIPEPEEMSKSKKEKKPKKEKPKEEIAEEEEDAEFLEELDAMNFDSD